MLSSSTRFNLAACSILATTFLVACGGSSTPPPVAQAALVAVATPSTILTTGTSTLSTTGGSGTGAVTYTLVSGPCTLSVTTLTPTAAGTCSISAKKAADTSYLEATSAAVSVTVNVPVPVLTLSTGFNGNGTTTNGGTWANGASWNSGGFTPASANTGLSGFGGGGWEQSPAVTTGGYVYFGAATPGQITGGYLDLYFTTPSPVTINGQTSITIPLAISTKWATQTNNKTINVILTNAWDGARNCNDAVAVNLSDVTSSLTTRTIPLSSFTAVTANACNPTKTAAEILAMPITSIHVQTSGANFNTTAVDTGTTNYATGFTIGSPVTLQ